MFTIVHFVIVFCGIISCLTVGTYCEQVNIAENDQYVNASDALHKYNVTLTCIGSNPELSFYIKNKVVWSFTDVKGHTQNITNGFSSDPNNEYAKAKFKSNSFTLNVEPVVFNNNSKMHEFVLQIIGVNHTDSGKYTCSLRNELQALIDSKQVTVTVINPVESITLELYKDNVQMIQKASPSTSSIREPTRLRSGIYKVRCSAYNSNPAPVMDFMFQNIEQRQVPQIQKQVSDVVRYNGTYETTIELSNHNYPQSLMCTANIPVKDIYPKMVFIEVLIPIEKPLISCNNLTAYETDHYRTVECSLVAPSQYIQLHCDKVWWLIKDINKNLSSGQIWKDPGSGYDIIETKCKQADDGTMLNATFTFFDMQPVHFSAMYFLVYGSSLEHPVQIYQLTATANPTSPILILIAFSLALASQQIGKYL